MADTAQPLTIEEEAVVREKRQFEQRGWPPMGQDGRPVTHPAGACEGCDWTRVWATLDAIRAKLELRDVWQGEERIFAERNVQLAADLATERAARQQAEQVVSDLTVQWEATTDRARMAEQERETLRNDLELSDLAREQNTRRADALVVLLDAAHAELATECAARQQAEQERQACGNLLARLNGDGGHRQDEVGVTQAAIEAESRVIAMMNTIARAEQERAEARTLLARIVAHWEVGVLMDGVEVDVDFVALLREARALLASR